VQALRDNENANKHKLQKTKMFIIFKSLCNTIQLCILALVDIVSRLPQFTDIFTKFNKVNLQLQRNGVNLIKAKSAIFNLHLLVQGLFYVKSPKKKTILSSTLPDFNEIWHTCLLQPQNLKFFVDRMIGFRDRGV